MPKDYEDYNNHDSGQPYFMRPSIAQSRRFTATFIAFLVILFSWPSQGEENVMPLTLAYKRTDSSNRASQLMVTIQAGMTRLDDNERTIFIDYGHRRLYRLEKGSTTCIAYPLPNFQHHEHSIIREKMIEELAKIQVQQEGAVEQTILGYPAKQAKILWGPGIERRRTAAPQAVEQYGLRFTSLWGKVWYTSDLPGSKELFRLANEYAPIFQQNPLLRRLDPLGLLAELGGVAIMQQYALHQDILKEVRRGSSETQRMELPVSCSGPP